MRSRPANQGRNGSWRSADRTSKCKRHITEPSASCRGDVWFALSQRENRRRKCRAGIDRKKTSTSDSSLAASMGGILSGCFRLIDRLGYRGDCVLVHLDFNVVRKLHQEGGVFDVSDQSVDAARSEKFIARL